MTKTFKKPLFFIALFIPCLINGAVALNAASVTTQTAGSTDKAKYIYEKPTRQKFSQMFWALDVFDIKKDADVDNFLLINDCDIYKDYKHNEFEWKNVRDSARNFLTEAKAEFPLRFELVQPLYLGDYNFEAKTFDILPDYKISARTRFEVMPADSKEKACGEIAIPSDYPSGIIAELNRPIDLKTLDVSEKIARSFIDEKMKNFSQLSEGEKNSATMSGVRDSYIFIQVKFLAYKSQFVDNQWQKMVELMTILEGVEIYADKEKKFLLWSRDYRKKPTKKKIAPKKEAPKTAPVTPAPAAVKEEEPAVPFAPQTPGSTTPIAPPAQ